MDVGLYAVTIENTQPVEGGRDVQFNVLAFIEHLENFVWATPHNIQLPFMSIFGYQYPPSLPHLSHSNVPVHLQDHMHLAFALLSEHSAHGIESAFSSMHVVMESRRFRCMRGGSWEIQGEMWCVPLIDPKG